MSSQLLCARVLPPEEWATKLIGTDLECVISDLRQRPEATQVVIVEDGSNVVGCWAVMNVLTVHGLWINPEYRKRGTVARRLLEAMKATVRRLGATAVATSACTPEIEALLDHAGGTRQPGIAYMLPMEAR